MPVEWSRETVSDHRKGITDLITNPDSAFQEESENLIYNYKLNLLSTRDEYGVAYSPLVPKDVSQIFQLEDYIICYGGNGDGYLDAKIDGQLYARLELDKLSAWSQVITPKSRTQSVTFNIANTDGKGFNLFIPDPFQMDNFIVKSGVSGSSPVVTYDQISKSIIITVDTAKITADKRYDTGGGVYLKWSWALGAFAITGSSTTLFSGTLTSEEVKFTGQLNIQTAPIAGSYYNANARSLGSGTPLPVFNESGHIQASEWSSHLYMANEPFNKIFIANPNDKYATDPDTYPPDNNRLPLRKLAPIATLPGVVPQGYALTCANAQLPKTFIGYDTSFTTSAIYDNTVATYQYQMLDCAMLYAGTKHTSDPYAFFQIFCERSWGRAGAVGDMPVQSYFFIRAVAQKDIDGLDNVFTLVDWNDRANANYVGYNIQWGQLYLVWHSLTNTKITATYTETIALISDAFVRYNKSARAAYMPFGYYIAPSPKAFVTDTLQLTTGQQASTQWYAALPDTVPGNYQYGYAFYLRDSYNALFEGAPRQFSFDGPTTFTQIRTLSKIGSTSVTAFFTSAKTTSASFSPAPVVWGGIAVRMRRETDLYYQTNIQAIFARTASQGDTYYIDQTVTTWLRTENTVPPTSTIMPASLIAANWSNTTGYIVPGQSSTADDKLIFNEEAYFNGGVLSYDSLPQGPYYFTVNNQIGYYANVVNNIQRVYQSAPSVVHATPTGLFVDFNDEITGINSFLDKPIVFTATKTWRMEGEKASDGSGRIIQRTISDEFGCISNQSVVQTNIGVFYWAANGIIYTDGLRAFRVTDHLIVRYNNWLANLRATDSEIGPQQLRGTFDELNRLVYWSCWDKAKKPFQIVMSLQEGPSPTMPFRVNNGLRYWDWNGDPGIVALPVDLYETRAMHYSSDTRELYKAQKNVIQKALPDTPGGVVLYKSIAFDFGMPWSRKFTTKIMLNLRDLNKAGVSMTPLSWNDLQAEPDRLANCLNYQHMIWAGDYHTPNDQTDLEHFFQQSDVQWKTDHIVTYKRHFSGRIRNVYKQVGFESLKYQYGVVVSELTPWASAIKVTLVSNNEQPWVKIEIRIDPTGTTDPDPLLGMQLGIGKFVTWEVDQEPLAIQKFFLDIRPADAETWYVIYVINDSAVPTNVADYVYYWNTIQFYQYLPQRIDLIGYTLTYRNIGDRTHGEKKAVMLGGNPNV